MRRLWQGPRSLLLAGLLLALLAAAPAAATRRGPAPSVAAIIAQTTKKTAAVKSFHFVVTVEHAPSNRPGLNLTYVNGDVIVPDRLAASIAGTLSGIPLRSALIFVGRQYFLRDPFSHAWRKLQVQTNPVAFFNPAKGVLAIIKGATGMQLVGSGNVGGTDCYRLRGKVKKSALTAILNTPPSSELVDLELLVGKKDLILRRARLQGAARAGDPPNAVYTIVISSFDKPVKIKAPEVTG